MGTNAAPTAQDSVVFTNAGTHHVVNLPYGVSQFESVAVYGGITLVLSSGFAVNQFDFHAGTIDGFGGVVVNAGGIWETGTFAGQNGLQIAQGATFSISSTNTHTFSGGYQSLFNRGQLTWSDNGSLSFIGANVFDNTGTLHITGAGRIDALNGGSMQIRNAGQIIRLGSGTTTLEGVTLNNENSLSIGSGTLTLRHSTLNSTGVLELGAGATLQLVSTTTTTSGTGSITGPGALLIQGGTADFNSTPSFAVDYLEVGDQATVVIGAAATAREFELLGGSFGGTGTLTVSETFTWIAGALGGPPLTLPPGGGVGGGMGGTMAPPLSGNVVVAATGTLVLEGGAERLLNGMGLYARGAVAWDYYGTIVRRNSVGVGGVTELFSNLAQQGYRGATTPPASPPAFNAALAAAQIYRALYGGATGAGTDEEAVYNALQGRTVEEIASIRLAYSAAYEQLDPNTGDWIPRNLNNDLDGDFSGLELDRVHFLLQGEQAGRPNADAAGLRFAMFGGVTGLGTDEDAVYRILAGPRRAEIIQAYQTLYGENPHRDDALLTDLRSEFSGDELLRVEAVLNGNSALADAATIRHALYDHLGSVETVFELLRNRSVAQINEIQTQYFVTYFLALSQDFDIWMSANEAAYGKALLTGDVIAASITRLRLAMDRAGTDEEAVWTTLDGTRSDQRAMFAQEYYRRYQDEQLEEAIRGDFTNTVVYGHELDKTLLLLEKGGLTLAQRIYFAVDGWGTDDPAIQRALNEMENMTADQMVQVNADYLVQSGGETLTNGLRGDLSGRDLYRAMLTLPGLPSNGDVALAVRVNRMLDMTRWEREAAGNLPNNLLQGLFNDHGHNLDVAVQQMVAVQNNGVMTAAERRIRLEQALLETRESMTAFQQARDSAAETVPNLVAAIAGIAVVIVSGGTATPIVVAYAAVAGGAAQALTRIGINGTFVIEDITNDVVMGAVNGGTAALSFPAATRAALADGTARIGVLRQIAGSAIAGGTVAATIGTALHDSNWSEGFAVGLLNVGQAVVTGGVLAGLPGASVFLARATGLSTLTRSFLTAPGVTTVRVFDATLFGAVRVLRGTGQTLRGALETVLTPQTYDSIALFLFNRTATETLDSIRTGLRSLLNDLHGPRLQFAVEAAMDVVQSSRNEFGTLGQAGIRSRLLDRVEGFFMSLSEGVESLRTRLRITGANVSVEISEQLANRLANLTENATEAEVRNALTEVLGQGVNVSDDMVRIIREFVSPELVPAGLPGSIQHKAARWQEYIDRGGAWSYDRWSRVYDRNMLEGKACKPSRCRLSRNPGMGRAGANR